MNLIDLSRKISHMMPRLPNHPSIIVTQFATHDEVREAEGYKFTNATMALVMGDHAGTHVDAPIHFDASPDARSVDQMPLEDFFLDAVCLDLSHKPLKSDISIADLEAAVDAAGVEIQPRDMVLLHMDFHRRTYGTPGYLTDFPGLTKESATWLGNKKICMFGVEAVSLYSGTSLSCQNFTTLIYTYFGGNGAVSIACSALKSWRNANLS